MERKAGVVIIVHGARILHSNERVVQFVRQVKERTGFDCVEPCFLEFGQPSIPEALEKLLRQGCTHLYGFALFLTPGRHLSEDVPALFRQTLDKHPGVTWELSPPLMDDPAMLEMVETRLRRALT